jgi:hypothetical protein
MSARAREATHRRDVIGPDVAKELNPVVQRILFAHLLELDHLWSIAADDEAHEGKKGTDVRRRGNEQVDALTVDETRDDDDRDCRSKEAEVRCFATCAEAQAEGLERTNRDLGLLAPALEERLTESRRSG